MAISTPDRAFVQSVIDESGLSAVTELILASVARRSLPTAMRPSAPLATTRFGGLDLRHDAAWHRNKRGCWALPLRSTRT
jgi:hypothetical protein